MKTKIQSGVVLVQKFISAGAKAFQGYIDYINRDEAVRNEAYTEYSIETLQDELNKYGNYMDYMGNPEKTTALFTAEKDRLTKDEKQKVKDIFEMAQQNDSLMWQTVISFDNRWLAEHGLYDLTTHTVNEAKLKECARGAMDRIIENENMAASAFWSGSIHYNTQHIHIHLALVEAFPTREIIQNGQYAGERKGKVKRATLEKAKSYVVNNMLDQKEANQSINDIIRKSIVSAFKDNIIIQDADLKQLYYEIYTKLPKNKRLWQYNRNVIRPIKKDIDSFITKWIEKYHKDDFDKLKKELQAQQQTYHIAYGSRKDQDRASYADNKINELYGRLGNTILSYLKTLEISEIELQPTSSTDTAEDLDNMETLSMEEIEKRLIEKYAEYDMENDAALLFFPAPEEFSIKRSAIYKRAKRLMYDKEERDFPKAFALLTLEAQTGNLYAIFDLAYLYSKGLGCTADPDKAYDMYSLALHGFEKEIANTKKQKNLKENVRKNRLANLHFRVAKMYYYGLGTDIDKKTAYQHFKISDENYGGNIFSKYYIAKFYEQGEVVKQDDHMAFLYYKDVADCTLNEEIFGSMPYSLYKVAQMLEQGKGTEQNTESADEYYKYALAEFLVSNEANPDDQLQYRIGKMYYEGKGTRPDIKKAKEFFESSAELGNDMANYMLAMIYLKDENADPQQIQKAIDMLTLSADPEGSNNALAQYQLGVIFLQSESEEEQNNGLKYLSLSAEQGNSFAQFKLGKYYLDSEPERAIKYLTQSADQGNQFAQYTLGSLFLSSESEKEQEKGLSYLLASAEQGNSFAQFRLGKYYLDADREKAITYLTKSADQENQFAQYKLGAILLSSKNEEDQEKGLAYLIAATEQENCFASYFLGKYYFTDAKIQDCQKAEQYLLQALRDRSKELSSFTGIEYQLGKLYTNGGKDFVPNPQKGIYYYTIAADQGNPFAQYALGMIYLDKDDPTEADIFTGLKYLKAASDQHNCFAEFQLGKAYLDGNIVTQDGQKAEQYLLQALQDRSKDISWFSAIEHNLGKLYFHGADNFESDTDKGISYYTIAADQGNQFSQYALGTIYLYGLNGIPRDLEKATDYLTKSADQGNEFASSLLVRMNTPQPQYIVPLYLNLNMTSNFSSLLRALGRDYTSYENYINQQIYQESQRAAEAEN